MVPHLVISCVGAVSRDLGTLQFNPALLLGVVLEGCADLYHLLEDEYDLGWEPTCLAAIEAIDREKEGVSMSIESKVESSEIILEYLPDVDQGASLDVLPVEVIVRVVAVLIIDVCLFVCDGTVAHLSSKVNRAVELL